jgi:uncharacterized membrane protein YdjX (TVP38/TMEM64 family)
MNLRTQVKGKRPNMSSTKLVVLVIGVLLGVASVLLAPGEMIQIEADFSWVGQLQSTMNTWGALAPLAFIGVYVAAVFLPALPSPVMAVAGGFLFGPYLGGLCTLLGVALGMAVSACAARIAGRTWLLRCLPVTWRERWHRTGINTSALGWGLLFLVPSSDTLYLAAGLTQIPIRRLTVAAVAGRSPTVVASTFAGSGLTGTLSLDEVMAVLLGLVALGLILSVVIRSVSNR